MSRTFLPISQNDLRQRNWDSLDIIIVTGDAYVDHPSYAAAIIGRVIESEGYRVGIIAQPDCRNIDDFRRLGRPRLFFAITAGNLDSMVANYTANRKRRSEDDYSPGGKTQLRPDRATIVYSNMVRRAYPHVNVVIGGIEASLRRLAHYDYWSDRVRHSILLDSKADILAHGMGERQIKDIASALDKGEDIKALDNIRGTVIARNNLEYFKNFVPIPSYEEVSKDKTLFNKAFSRVYNEADPYRGRAIAQKDGGRYVVQLPPAIPLTTDEIDSMYNLPYTMMPHPEYERLGGVPGFETIRFSVTSHRGCPGECSFCSLYMHQGRIIQSRSKSSILDEIKNISRRADFKGTITDIGGPTANLYEASCIKWRPNTGSCEDKKCLFPHKCTNLKTGHKKTINLWREASKIPGVKHIFIGSGMRYDLLLENGADEYLKELCAKHISGRLKVAPEHTEDSTLRLMNKPPLKVYEDFVKKFDRINKNLKKKQYLVNYLIVGHPGTTLKDALLMAIKLKRMGIVPEQIQDYLPLPMTVSSCMYYTGKDPFTGEPVYVAKRGRERKMQRALVQYRQKGNKRYVIEALRELGRMDLLREFYR